MRRVPQPTGCRASSLQKPACFRPPTELGLTYAQIVAAVVLLGACSGRNTTTGSAAPEPQAYLFSYFTGNGEDGVHLAYSRDGISWAALNGGKSVITPGINGSGRGWQEWNTTAALMWRSEHSART